MNLELAAMRWLWLEQKCLVVLQERTPVYAAGIPDVIGITPGRYITEIEIKRSASDFRADFRKSHRANREFYLKQMPRQFYYMMPFGLANKLHDKIPAWAGLMTSEDGVNAMVVERAPINSQSDKLGLKQCIRLSRMMTAHMMGYAVANNSIKENWKNG